MEDEIKDGFEFDGTGLSTTEKHWGEKRFNDYKAKYSIENISDLSLLSEKVFREALQIRYKKQIEKYSKSKTTEEYRIPAVYLKTLDENLDRILIINKELGLQEAKKSDNFYDYITQLKNKFKLWREENQGTRQVVCPFCGKLFFLMIRTDKYEARKPSMFKDKILANKELWLLYKNGRLTKEEVAKVLGTPVDYISWLIEKFYERDSNA